MFCKKCGAENNDNARFCKKCGEPLGNMQKDDREKNMSEGLHGYEAADEIEVGKRVGKDNLKKAAGGFGKLPKKALAAGAAAAAGAVLFAGFSISNANNIDLNKYLEITADGYNEYGTAYVNIDWDAIEEKYEKKLVYRNDISGQRFAYTYYMEPLDIMKEYVHVIPEQTSDLANGMEVPYTWKIDDELYEFLDIKLKHKDGVLEVKELEEPEKWNAFEALELCYDGTEPYGEVSLKYNDKKLNTSAFSCSRTSGLRNGDVITVSIDDTAAENCVRQYGVIPEEYTKEYTVDGIPAYVSRMDQLSEAQQEQLVRDGRDAMISYAASQWDSETEMLLDVKPVGSSLLVNKNVDDNDHNMIIEMYKVKVRNCYSDDGETFDETMEYFWITAFENIKVKSDGQLVYSSTDYRIPSNEFRIDSGVSTGWWSTMGWRYKGYRDFDELYRKEVTARTDEYTAEDMIDRTLTMIEERKESGWKEEEGGWRYYDEDGAYIKDSRFDDPETGKSYYFDENGYMMANDVTPDGKQIGEDGVITE
ncbi:MAG: zinc-ribbon domain-containing protein [Clostridiales bacterium]|nr:zinc-ribbon domain-containing protein [Clostridiales bacterium]